MHGVEVIFDFFFALLRAGNNSGSRKERRSLITVGIHEHRTKLSYCRVKGLTVAFPGQQKVFSDTLDPTVALYELRGFVRYLDMKHI